MRTLPSIVKLLVFVVVTSIAGMLVAALAGNLRFGPSHDYSAVFTSASGIAAGSEVRVAGVPVGTVTGVSLAGTDSALVRFTVDSTQAMSQQIHATIRYKNLIGDRYVQLAPGDGPDEPLRPGGQIPESRTTPALDIDQLVNGFRPLLQGLDPAETNRVASSLIAVLNGQEAAVTDLVSTLGIVTNALADHDQQIGQILDDFRVVLATVSQRRDSTDRLLDGLATLVSRLAQDSPRIGTDLATIDGLTGALADVVTSIRPDLATSVRGLDRLSGNLDRDTDTLQLVLAKLPDAYRLIGRASGYGSFVNFFVCGLAVRYGPGRADQTPMLTLPAARCQP